MSKHTSGKWTTDDANPELVAVLVNGKYEYICDCDVHRFSNSNLSQEEQEANAKLIAASPTQHYTLVAIEKLADESISALTKDKGDDGTIDVFIMIRESARAAIKKATE